MDKKKKLKKKQRKWEERSDRRTAEYVVRRLDELQTDLVLRHP